MKKQNFMGTCHYCHKKGHREAECRTKLNDNANNVEEEHALMTSYCVHKDNAEMWIGDTGVTCHMKSLTEGMYELENATISKLTLQMVPHHRLLISESIKVTSYVLMEKSRK